MKMPDKLFGKFVGDFMDRVVGELKKDWEHAKEPIEYYKQALKEIKAMGYELTKEQKKSLKTMIENWYFIASPKPL